jgi:hypothetical protein
VASGAEQKLGGKAEAMPHELVSRNLSGLWALLPTRDFDTPLYAGTRADLSLGPAGVSARATVVRGVREMQCRLELFREATAFPRNS